MTKKNPKVDEYLVDGCGRCSFYKTPQCKVNRWRKELTQLRKIALDSGLTEDLKWRQPCYTFDGNNIVLVSAFKEYCALNFIKGSLLKDSEGVLDKPGENSQAARQFRFTDVKDIIAAESIVKKYIKEAIDIEKAGLRVDFKEKKELVFPEELLKKFEDDPDFQEAFAALTPGRQRAYNLYFSAAKQSNTRTSRIEKHVKRILQGKGMND